MSHPGYRYQPWSEERRARASAAAKSRKGSKKVANAPREDPSITAFRNADAKGRGEMLAALTTLLKLYSKRPSDPEFTRYLIAFYSRLTHIVVREAAEGIERMERPPA